MLSCVLIAIVCLPALLTFVWFSEVLAGCFALRKWGNSSVVTPGALPHRMTVLIPAHNEGVGVLPTIRDIQAQADLGNARAKLALDVLVHQARHWIGAYYLELNGADALVFTAGIGENSTEIRRRICAGLEFLGVDISSAANAENAPVISTGRVTVRVMPTNEELMIARHTGLQLGLALKAS
jgi:hypothetical protein